MMTSHMMNDERLDQVKEKHGEEKMEKFMDENEELVLDIVMAVSHSIGLNMKEKLSTVVEGLEEEIEEIEDYFDAEEEESE